MLVEGTCSQILYLCGDHWIENYLVGRDALDLTCVSSNGSQVIVLASFKHSEKGNHLSTVDT